MSAEDIDGYFAGVEQSKRATLEEMRRRILELLPDADQAISYGYPTFKVNGKTIAGLAAFKNDLSYLPYTGAVLAEVADLTGGYTHTKGLLCFPVQCSGAGCSSGTASCGRSLQTRYEV